MIIYAISSTIVYQFGNVDHIIKNISFKKVKFFFILTIAI